MTNQKIKSDEVAFEVGGTGGRVYVRCIIWEYTDPVDGFRSVKDIIEWDLVADPNMKVMAAYLKKHIDGRCIDVKFILPDGFEPFKNGTTRTDTRIRAIVEYLLVKRLVELDQAVGVHATI